MKVELSDEAKTEVARVDAWWRQNRPAAPDLFLDELEEALIALADAPALGTHYDARPGVRRMLLKRTHYHLYLVEESDRVFVVAVWSTYRGRGPALSSPRPPAAGPSPGLPGGGRGMHGASPWV